MRRGELQRSDRMPARVIDELAPKAVFSRIGCEPRGKGDLVGCEAVDLSSHMLLRQTRTEKACDGHLMVVVVFMFLLEDMLARLDWVATSG